MKIFVPSYNAKGRIINPDIFNKPEVTFCVRPEQEQWYKENFPSTTVIATQTDPPGLNCLIKTQQWIFDEWKKDTSTEEFCCVTDDDIKEIIYFPEKGKLCIPMMECCLLAY